MVIALVVSIALVILNRPYSAVPDLVVSDLIGTSGERVFLSSDDGQTVVETSQLGGLAAFREPTDAQLSAQDRYSQEEIERIHWVHETRMRPDGSVRQDVFSLTQAGLVFEGRTDSGISYTTWDEPLLEIPADAKPGTYWRQTVDVFWSKQGEIDTGTDSMMTWSRQGWVDDAGEGCLKFTYEDAVTTVDVADPEAEPETQTLNETVTRCPGQGIIAIDDATLAPAQTQDASDLLKVPQPTPAVVEAPTPLTVTGSIGIEVKTPTVHQPVALGDGVLINHLESHQLVFIQPMDAQTWQIGWSRRPGTDVTAMLGVGELAVVGTSEGKLVAYSTQGTWQWEADAGDVVTGISRVDDDTAAVITANGALRLYDVGTGELEQDVSTSEGVNQLTGIPGQVPGAAGISDSQLTLLAGDTAQQIGLPDTASSVTAASERLIVSTATRLLSYTLDGELAWDQPLPDACLQLAVDDETIVCRSSEALSAHSLTDGHQLWRTALELDAMAVADSQIIASGPHHIWTLDRAGTVTNDWPGSARNLSSWLVMTTQGPMVVGADGQMMWWRR